MPKDKKSKIGGTKSKNTQPSVDVPEPSLAALQQLQESGKKANLNSRQTRRNYAGYVKRGRDWLAGHFSGEDSSSVPKGVDKQELSPLLDDVYQDPDFKNAFNERPNRYTHQALALFISYKCFHQNLKAGTGTGIHAAFKKYWEQLSVNLRLLLDFKSQNLTHINTGMVGPIGESGTTMKLENDGKATLPVRQKLLMCWLP